MKITKLGHCCLLIEIRGKRFLTDPGNYTTAQDSVMNIDYIVISHEHTDHLHIDSVKNIIKNSPEVKIICNSSVGKILEKESIQYTKVSHGEKMVIEGIEISGHGIKHAPIYKDYEQVENTGYMFDNKFFYPGDAFYKPDVSVDILAFPVTGPWCNIADAIDYVVDVKPKVAFPVHDGNLLRQNGITVSLPNIFLPKQGIEFIVLELGKEKEF